MGSVGVGRIPAACTGVACIGAACTPKILAPMFGCWVLGWTTGWRVREPKKLSNESDCFGYSMKLTKRIRNKDSKKFSPEMFVKPLSPVLGRVLAVVQMVAPHRHCLAPHWKVANYTVSRNCLYLCLVRGY